MNERLIKSVCFSIAMLSISAVCAGEPSIEGKYTDKNGAILDVAKTNETSQYKITSSEPGGYIWESVGFYSSNCNCIKSVFRYLSDKNKYGDNAGYHKFEVKNNGEAIIKNGGWDGISEFGKGSIYTRSR